MLWLAQTVGSSVIGIALTMGAAYLLYRYKQRPIVSIEVVVDTQAATPKIDLVITNHGRSAVVITELSAYVPARDIMPDLPPLTPPSFKKRGVFEIRRKGDTHGNRNEICEMLAEGWLSNGAAKADLTRRKETIRIEPNEKAARPIGQQGLSPFLIKLHTPNSITLVPSCKIANQQHAIWGLPVMVGSYATDGHSISMVGGLSWP